jgi:hypothetical protein
MMILNVAAWAIPCACAAESSLAIVSPLMEQSDGGGALPPGFTHVPGETIFFSFKVEGYKASSAERVNLSYQIEAFDPNGVPIVEPVKDIAEATLAPEDKNWKPLVHHEIPIPTLAPSGTYRIVASIKDLIGEATATKEVTFQVRGHAVEPSATMVVRNFHFYRKEDDFEALPKAAYQAGDAVWARFDIIGFKYGEANAIDVTYGVTVTAPSGKVLYTQAEAAVDKSQSFYPKRYVPGVMSLETRHDTRAGEYGVVIAVRDGVGGQTCESRQSFTIE